MTDSRLALGGWGLAHGAELRELSVLSRLPDSLRRGGRSWWGDTFLPGRAVDSFLEGPVLLADGSVLMSDIPSGRVLKYDAGGAWSVHAEPGGAPNGLAQDAGGRLYACDMAGRIVAVHAGGMAEVVLERVGGEALLGPSDLAVLPNGRIVFTDQGLSGLDNPVGRVVAREPDGSATVLMGGIPSPNGIALAADGCTLYVSVTRANAIWRLPLTPAGAVHRAGQFIAFSGGFGPDGLAVSAEGDLFVAHLGTGVWRFDADGAPRSLFRAPSGARHVSNVVLDRCNERLIATEASQGLLLQASTG